MASSTSTGGAVGASAMTTADNYHLKWDSHSSYLNMSVASLFKNERFADVMLFSSCPDGGGGGGGGSGMFSFGSGIPAHKFILSSCSQFFASLFESSSLLPATNSGQTYIVLPSELSRRSIKILVQYMYSGEATVSNDILKEVLRGGELLKIRGLCRTTSGTAKSSTAEPVLQQAQPTVHPSTQQLMDRPTSTSYSTRSIDSDYRTEFRSLGASVLPKESPVIVRSPKPAQIPALGPLTVNTGSQNLISVNKDVATDPDQKCYCGCQTAAPPPKNAAICTDTNCRKCPPAVQSFEMSERNRRHSEDFVSLPKASVPSSSAQRERDSDAQRINTRRISLSTMSTSDAMTRAPIDFSSGQNTKHFPSRSSIIERTDESPDPLEPALFPNIKEEPRDWHSENENSTPGRGENIVKALLDAVKAECPSSDDEESSCDNKDFFTELKCEVCHQIFTDSKEWLKHIDSHGLDGAMSDGGNTPAKRPRTDSAEESVALLTCDVCQTLFTTPADWVRHMQQEHTETELAISNSNLKRPVRPEGRPEAKKVPRIPSLAKDSRNYLQYLERVCEVCNKKFDSYTSMVIHRRSHDPALANHSHLPAADFGDISSSYTRKLSTESK